MSSRLRGVHGLALTGSLALACAAPCQADDFVGEIDTGAENAARGVFSVAVQSLHTGSLISDSGTIPGKTETDTQVLRIALDYRLGERWEAHVSLPYIRKRSNGGAGAHRLDILEVPHPEATFLDDTQYHSNWQDWQLGLARHGQWRGFHVVPSVRVHLPSHDYSFFGNAATGQRLRRLELGIDLSRQLTHSNFYYSVGYSYMMQEEVGGVNADKNRLRATVGYLFTPRFSARAFANGSYGKGRDSSDFTERRSEAWYHHDQTSRHNYAIVGLGVGYQLTPKIALSASAATLVWGRTVHDLKHAYELQVSRSF